MTEIQVIENRPTLYVIRSFWATVCKTVRPMLSDHCLSVLSVLSVCPVCDVGALWLNGLTDQDETWHAVRPRPNRMPSWVPVPHAWSKA